MPSDPDHLVRVVVVDRYQVIRAALRVLIGTIEGVELVGEASDRVELLELLASVRADVVVSGVNVPDTSGLATISVLRKLHPHLPVVAISMDDSSGVSDLAVEAGASAVVYKGACSSELERALRSVSLRVFSQLQDRRVGSSTEAIEKARSVQKNS